MRLKEANLFFAAAFSLLFLYQPCRAQYPSEAEHDWVNGRFFAVLNELLPIEERLGFSLGYRSYRDLYTNELEYSFVFNRFLQERYITVVVRAADSVSLYDQVMALHRKNPNASIEDIRKQLKVKELRLSEETCPAVGRQHNEFYRLSVPMLSARDRAGQARGEFSITLHPRVHKFKADISGGSMELVLTESDHPLVRWATRTQRAFEICAGNPARQNRTDR